MGRKFTSCEMGLEGYPKLTEGHLKSLMPNCLVDSVFISQIHSVFSNSNVLV